MQLLLRWVISAIALYITVLIGQHFHLGLSVGGPVPALLAVVALAVVNAVIRPIVGFLAMPLSCLTFGLFGLLINALMFWLVSLVVPGFHVSTIWGALFGSVVMGLVSGALNNLLISDKERGKN